MRASIGNDLVVEEFILIKTFVKGVEIKALHLGFVLLYAVR